MPDLQRRQFLPWTGPGTDSGVFDGNKVQDINDLKNALAKGIKEAVDRLDEAKLKKFVPPYSSKKKLKEAILDEFDKYFSIIK